MPEVAVYTPEGSASRRVALRDDVFGITPHAAVLHQAVVRQLADRRVGTHDTKTRGEVAGGGRKAWRQKGTGRARQGSRRAPHWRGGGVVFGPHPRDYRQALPKQMRRLALRSALASKAAEGRLLVVEALHMEAPSTKQFKSLLDRLGVERSALVLLPNGEQTVRLSARNLPHVKTMSPDSLNVVDVLRFDHLVVPLDVLRIIEDRLGGSRQQVSAEAEGAEAAAQAEPPAPADESPDAPATPVTPVAGEAPAAGPGVPERVASEPDEPRAPEE